jgi:NTE family protein
MGRHRAPARGRESRDQGGDRRLGRGDERRGPGLGPDRGGRAGAIKRLESYWRAVNQQGGRNVFGDSSVWNSAFNPDWMKSMPGWRMAETFALAMSPYEFNPFNLDPMHDVLEREIDFEAIRERSPIKLYVSATAVRHSQAKVFRGPELTART